VPAIPDRLFNAACGRLASQLGISLAAARRRVEIRAAREGCRSTAERLDLAERMLEEARAGGEDRAALFDAQLGAVGSDEHFMLED
jgi:hypothetical protein